MFVLQRKREEKGEIQRYKAQFFVCGNKVQHNEEESFSPVMYFTIVKIILSMASQSGGKKKH